MMNTKNCPRCGLAVSDEYRFCLQCGTDLKIETDSQEPPPPDSQVLPPTVVWPEATQPPPAGPTVGGSRQSQAPQSTIVFQGPSPNPRSVSSTIDPPHSKLPWFLLGICVLVIGILCYVTIFRSKSSKNDNSLAQLQSATPFPSATPSPVDTSAPAAASSQTPTRSPSASPSPTDTASTTPLATSSPTPTTTSSQAPSPSTQTAPTQEPAPSTAPTITPVESPTINTAREPDQPVAILSQPPPNYTEEARKKRVVGTVVLRVVLGADGSIGTISVVSGLPNGLSERAIIAARNIRFVPAKKNGVAVSTVVQLEYNFRLE